jgi:hypothetical protein
MFGFHKNKEDNFAMIIAERENFLSALMAVMQSLNNSGNHAQSEFIQKLIELISQNNFSHFVKLINGVDMWGGAGAVWEIYIENKTEAREFEKKMLRLISLMEKTKIIGKGIKPIKKLFEDNLNKE